MNSFQCIFNLTHDFPQVGTKSLKGEWEYIGGKLFEGMRHVRNITGKGKLIEIYDPKADMNSPPLWEHDKEDTYASHEVPPGYEVRVVGATIKFT